MTTNLSPSEQLTYSTVRIECTYKNGEMGTGTGFFFRFKEDKKTEQYIPVIITNKHVVKNAVKGKLTISKADKSGHPLDSSHHNIELNNFESLWKNHPDDNVDLCAIPIGPYINDAINSGISLFYVSLEKSLLPTKEQLSDFSALEDILMIGYPNGIWDHVNNKPILRTGVTATHPNFDYQGKKEIMIDAACFPGSSGSPVFIFNEGGYTDKKGNLFMGKNRVILLGILFSGPQQTTAGEIKVVDIPTSQKPISVSLIPINLGNIIKSERIIELENSF